MEIDLAPFTEAARLLYEGPWVAERFLVIESLLRSHPEAVHPVTRGIIEDGAPHRVYVCTRCLKAAKVTKAR